MKNVLGWWFPDHERHLPEWLAHPKNQVVMNGRRAYQGKKQLAALALCKSFRTAVDVGGHVGLWSFNLANRFATVHAFEPVPEHRDCFFQNVTLSNVRMHALALGAEPGFVSIATEQGSSGNSHVSAGGDVRMVTLDSMALQDVDFIKIDVEGFEESVCRGAAETIKAFRPVMVVEQKREMAQRFNLPLLGAVRYLESQGYRVAQEISGDYIMVPHA